MDSPSKSDPTILILGATGTTGSSLAATLANRPGSLYLGGRDAKRVASLAERVGGSALTVDVTRAEDVHQAVEHVVEEQGRLDAVVNCAGTLLLKPAHLTTEAELEDTLRVNLFSAFYTVKSAARAMMRTGGSIVLVSSAAARTGMANHEAIAAAKAGVEGLVRSAAATYGARNIRVNAVAPGMLRSSLTEKLLSNDLIRQASESMHALGRIGEASDVASMIAMLLSPEQSWITGQVFGVDGGLATLRTRQKAS